MMHRAKSILIAIAALTCGARADDGSSDRAIAHVLRPSTGASPQPAEKQKNAPKNASQGDSKKRQSTAKNPLPQPGRSGEEPAPRDERQEKLKEAISRLTQNLGAAESRLGKKDTGQGTQQVQRDILKDLDLLIEEKDRRDQEQQQEQNQGTASGTTKGRPQQRLADDRKQAPGSERRTVSRPADRAKEPKPPSTVANRKQEMSKIADLYKDIWGHLPETLRQEMDQYSRERFMPKYEELLKQYYATIAEKGKRKESDRKTWGDR